MSWPGKKLCLAALLFASASPSALANSADPGVSAQSSDRMRAVVDTLEDIISSIEDEEKKEEQNYAAFKSWCMSETRATSDALNMTQQQFEEAHASKQELEATVEQLRQVMTDSTAELEEAKDTMAKAVSLREKDHEKYDEEKQINQQSIGQITSAVNIVGEVHGQDAVGFLQSSSRRNVAKHQQHLSEPGESSYVLGIMKGLKDRLEQTRQSMDTTEGAAVQRHEAFVSTEKQRMSVLQKTIVVKQEEHSSERVKLVEATRLGERLGKELEELGIVLADVTKQCEEKNRWWEIRVADRKEEKANLRKAIDVISESSAVNPNATAPPSVSFIQAQAVSTHRVVGRVTQQHGLHRSLLGVANAQLAAVAAGARSGIGEAGRKGMLSSAKAVVEELIGVLKKEQEDETKMKKYCEKELERKDGEQAAVTAEIERLNASIERKTTEVELLSSEVTAIEHALDLLKISLDNATTIRRSDKSIYETGTKDRNLAVKVLMQAKAILETFYATSDPTALNQQAASPAPEVANPESSRKEIRSLTVVQIVEKVADEIMKEQKDADIEETEAASAFEQLQTDSRNEFDEQMQAITERVKLKAKTLVQLGTDKETHTQKVEDHAAVTLQLGSLHEQCDQLLKNFEQRLKARDFEVSQLKDVIDILSGSQIAARTGLMQEARSDAKIAAAQQPSDSRAMSPMDAREMALMRDLSQEAAEVGTSI